MARVELSYQERIKELEQEKHDLKERLWEVDIIAIIIIIYHQHDHNQASRSSSIIPNKMTMIKIKTLIAIILTTQIILMIIPTT